MLSFASKPEPYDKLKDPIYSSMCSQKEWLDLTSDQKQNIISKLDLVLAEFIKKYINNLYIEQITVKDLVGAPDLTGALTAKYIKVNEAKEWHSAEVLSLCVEDQ